MHTVKNTRSVILVLLAIMLITLTGCGTARVSINRSSVYLDNIVLPIRQGYQFAEDCYSVTDTDDGYDIVIHLEQCEGGVLP